MMSYQDLDPDPDGDFGVLDRRTAPGGGCEGKSLESHAASTVHTLPDASMQDDTEEETDSGSSGENLEQRLQMLERKIEKNNRSNYEVTKAMNECVVVRDEQIRTQMVEIERKDCVMADMTIKILKSERKIDKLLEIVKKLQRKVNKDGEVEETSLKGNNPVPENKPRSKTRWEPIGPSFESSLTVEPFVKYFVVRVEEGKKRTMCPFQIETDLAN